ncbi:hypothetical protein HU200_057532 [Digitaria exilis]|uniref:Uncharacterized protein n=1 Tax=Digitaria exilis TaxID=1010633 RepID=A0A835AER8_9POAL|nr:hypothetical protein HU200_057532 [Digitaria exilis]
MPASAAAVLKALATGPGSRVTRFAKSTAASVTPVRPGRTHALSPLDNAMERHTVHVVLYYRAAPGLDRDQLKESLSRGALALPGHDRPPHARRGRRRRGGSHGRGGRDACAARVGRQVQRRWRADGGTPGRRRRSTSGSPRRTGDEEMDLLYYEPVGPETYIWSPFYIQVRTIDDLLSDRVRGQILRAGLSCTHIHQRPHRGGALSRPGPPRTAEQTSTYPPFLHAPAFEVSPASHSPSPPLLADKVQGGRLSFPSPMPPPCPPPRSTPGVRGARAPASLEPRQPPRSPALAALFWLRSPGEDGERELTVALDFPQADARAAAVGLLRQRRPPHARARRPRRRSSRRRGGAGTATSAGVPEDDLWRAVEWLHARQQQQLEDAAPASRSRCTGRS